jgi:putative iron-dependent peroxidase
VAIPQTGIFALGTASHAYLEFDRLDGIQPTEVVRAVAALDEPRTTMGGVNLVTGIRPELWAAAAPSAAPAGLIGFDEPVVGPDGYTMPATQHDVALWISGASYDIVFDASNLIIAALADVLALAEETVGWAYHRDLDLTGFIDGSENPALSSAADLIAIPPGSPGDGGSVLLLQKWLHDTASWSRLASDAQERVIGRTKADSVELDPRPETSHVARTDQDDFGHILRRNTAFGTVREHGTMFVGFAAERRFLADMLASMAGSSGDRDALTRYTRPLTGAYYFVPSTDDLNAADSANPQAAT